MKVIFFLLTKLGRRNNTPNSSKVRQQVNSKKKVQPAEVTRQTRITSAQTLNCVFHQKDYFIYHK